MIAITFSILLFGLIHPLSKVLLDSGIPFSFFCLSYIGVRLFVQFPLNIKFNPLNFKKNQQPLIALITFGFVGAGLQFFEFKGIDSGLSPGTVTFIMFSYPIWLAVLSFFTDKTHRFKKIISGLLSALGVLLITGGSLQEIQQQTLSLIFPLAASACLALWIFFSSRLRRQGVKALRLSFYYDFFAFIALLIILNQQLFVDYTDFKSWLNFQTGSYLILYSLVIGLLPNLLFYFGSKKVTSYQAGMAMAFEPVLSSLYSSFIWELSFSMFFWIGAIFIVLANVPLPIKKNTVFQNWL